LLLYRVQSIIMRVLLSLLLLFVTIAIVHAQERAAYPAAWTTRLIDITGVVTTASGYCKLYWDTNTGLSWSCYWTAPAGILITAISIKGASTLPSKGDLVYSITTDPTTITSPFMGSWYPSTNEYIDALFADKLYITLDTATKADYILGQIADDGTSTIPPITTTFTYSAELTNTQIATPQVPTNFSGGVMLVNRVNNNLYCFMVHSVSSPTSITLHVADPGIHNPSIILTLCSTAASCASPFSSTRLDASVTYLGESVVSYLNSYTDDGTYGQVFVSINSDSYPLGEARGQVSRVVAPTKPDTGSVSSTGGGGGLSGSTSTAIMSPIVQLLTVVIAIVAIRRN